MSPFLPEEGDPGRGEQPIDVLLRLGGFGGLDLAWREVRRQHPQESYMKARSSTLRRKPIQVV